MKQLLLVTSRDTIRAVAPLIAAVCVMQVVLVRAPAGLFVQFLVGSTLATFGMVLLFAGIDLGILPMGRFIGAELPKKRSLWLILGVAFALGFATTAAEPDVLVLAGQAERTSSGTVPSATLIAIIAAGVGLLTAVALLRVVRGWSMPTVLTCVYGVMLLLSFVSPAKFVPLAYDAGSVTTGVLTAPVVLAVALGLTSVLAQRSALSDGFGVLGLASVGAILAVLLLGIVL